MRLEQELERQLDVALSLRLVDLAKVSRRGRECRRPSDEVQNRMVEEVDEVGPELQRLALRDAEVFMQTQVNIRVPRTPQ